MSRRLVASGFVPVLLCAALTLCGGGSARTIVATEAPPRPSPPPSSAPEVERASPPAASPAPAPARASEAQAVSLRLEHRIGGRIEPKSLRATPSGLVFAQNMMYQHSVTVYRPDGSRAATIPDAVDLDRFGVEGHHGLAFGAPVEAAATPDGRHVWVSNYSMYGAGYGPEGSDSCQIGDGTDESTAYRIDVGTLAIDAVVPVGAVPKYVAVTPDGRSVLVTNWCSGDLSVIDTGSLTEVARIPLGLYPRGIAVTPDSTTAYVALMSSRSVLEVDLAGRRVVRLLDVGQGPRDLVLHGGTLYATLNAEGVVAAVDLATGRVTGRVSTGSAPRSMTITPDGRFLVVVNYLSDTVSVVDAASMRVLHSAPTDPLPIGITYEPTTDRVWVACYTGSILIFSIVGR